MHRVVAVAEPSEQWDLFVEAQDSFSLGHASCWGAVLLEAYGFSPRYFEARSADGSLLGVLTLAAFRGLGQRREYISLPFLDSVGVLACNEHAESDLVEAALSWVRSAGARSLELRQSNPLLARPNAQGGLRVGLTLKLESTIEAQWSAIGAKNRNQTRKAKREGLRLTCGSADQLLDGFYQPFCTNMRDLGSPVHSRRFFAAVARAFGDRMRFIVTCLNGRPVGGLVAIHYGDTVTVPWASTLRSERRRCPNNQVYWEAMRWAIERGARVFDFGRSPVGSGTHRFKRGWGAKEQPLNWVRLSPDGALLPIRDEPGPMLRRLSQLWTHLPVSLASALGPRVRRFLAN